LSDVKTSVILLTEDYIRRVKMDIEARIKELKKEKDAVILAHYYVDGRVQEVADYVGDSYYLSKIASETPNKVIVFCGVLFMAESAKVLSPEKTVLMPDKVADCPMAHMAKVEDIASIREKYDDLAVVCYINSTTEIKANSDVCVTSSNAEKVIKKLPQKNIYFIPDSNLGRYLSSLIPDKNFILNGGYCHVHNNVIAKDVKDKKAKYPNSKLLAHPECTKEVLDMADYVGSTSGIIEYVANSQDNSFIICTEEGVLYKLKKENPDIEFILINNKQVCPDMKRVTIDKLVKCLEAMDNQISVDEEVGAKAFLALEKMLELAR
jgi:quinolinate synthase